MASTRRCQRHRRRAQGPLPVRLSPLSHGVHNGEANFNHHDVMAGRASCQWHDSEAPAQAELRRRCALGSGSESGPPCGIRVMIQVASRTQMRLLAIATVTLCVPRCGVHMPLAVPQAHWQAAAAAGRARCGRRQAGCGVGWRPAPSGLGRIIRGCQAHRPTQSQFK
jgi:hypothetical protein